MKKALMIIGGIVVAIFLCTGGFLFYQYQTSDQLICESEVGSITLLYDEDTIKGYFAKGITYNLDEQRAYAENVGIEAYLKEFADFFLHNMNGTCRKK